MACLSSRIPYGEKVTPEKLKMIEEAEYVLRDLGFRDVRVRHHEFSSKLSVPAPTPAAGGPQLGTPHSELGTTMHLARIEVAPEELPKFLGNGTAQKVAESLKKLGYAHVTLDLQGYRRGSVNEMIALANPSASSAV